MVTHNIPKNLEKTALTSLLRYKDGKGINPGMTAQLQTSYPISNETKKISESELRLKFLQSPNWNQSAKNGEIDWLSKNPNWTKEISVSNKQEEIIENFAFKTFYYGDKKQYELTKNILSDKNLREIFIKHKSYSELDFWLLKKIEEENI